MRPCFLSTNIAKKCSNSVSNVGLQGLDIGIQKARTRCCSFRARGFAVPIQPKTSNCIHAEYVQTDYLSVRGASFLFLSLPISEEPVGKR